MGLVATKENLRIRLESELKGRVDDMLSRKRLSLQDAFEAMCEWIVEQDDVVQSMVFGQLDPTPDLVELVVMRLSEQRDTERTSAKQKPPRK